MKKVYKVSQVQCFCHASCCNFDYYPYYLLMDLLNIASWILIICWIDVGARLREGEFGNLGSSVRNDGGCFSGAMGIFCILLDVDGRSKGPDSWWCAASVCCVTCDLLVNDNSECDVSVWFVWRIIVKYRFRRVFLKFVIGRIIVIRWPVAYEFFFF